MPSEDVDVLIVGAGLSGIGAAVHLQTRCPGKTYAILEGRETLGGTWDLFRYPGIRSDSDMYTLGYSFRPWTSAKSIADGPSILDYVQETACAFGVQDHIRFDHRVKRASWSSEAARWTVSAEQKGPEGVTRLTTLTCNFLFMCSGYYDYEKGYTPDFPGVEDYRGRLVHPQKWTPDTDYAGKRVVVIGSGATAVTLVPELAKKAARVTMLQRSPTYVVSRPSEDRLANGLRRHVSPKVAYGATRWKNVLLAMAFFRLSKQRPEGMKRLFLKGVRQQLGRDYDVGTHFTPTYKPWDQRVCLVPDGDLFKAIRDGRAEVMTDRIETFTERGLKLASGKEIEADLVVTATGLNLKVLGGVEFTVDGAKVVARDKITYRGLMYSDVPNMAFAVGYTNASWTLKCDLTSEYVCRLINHLSERGLRQCTARNHDPSVKAEPWIDFTSGYVQRSIDLFPRQGSKAPWKLHQNYLRDLLTLRYVSLDDVALEFSNPAPGAGPPARRGVPAFLSGLRGWRRRWSAAQRV